MQNEDNSTAVLVADNNNYDVDKIGMGYLTATGEIKYSLRSDLMFHIVMNKSKEALKGLICALKGLKYEDVKDVSILNPIDFSDCIGKVIVMDVKVELNNSEIIDVELQLYSDCDWEKRSLLYLCRAFDNIGQSENYSSIMPTTFIAITETKCISKKYKPEFYSKYRFLNEENYEPYSSLLGINVLYLDQTELATDEDKKCKLDYWAKLFKAATWEELKAIVKDNPCMEEVAKIMYSSNVMPKEKIMLELERNAKHYQHCMYQNGYNDAKKEDEELIKENENLKAQIEELKKQLGK